MKFPFLASFIILILVVGHNIRKQRRTKEHSEQDFWSREAEANSVRKKSLDDLNYITIPLDTLPVGSHSEDAIVKECTELLHTLAEQKIVNFTGISNTDLKLTYGTANITALTEYDQNFTLLVTTLQKWADALQTLGDITGTKAILEYAVSIRSDISKTYFTLAALYVQTGEESKISSLIEIAEGLSTPSGKIIVRRLKQEYPHS